MRMPVVALLGLAALALAPFFAISPNTTTTARRGIRGFLSRIDIFDLTRACKVSPEAAPSLAVAFATAGMLGRTLPEA